MNWNPLFFEPIVKERIWGGQKLSNLFEKKTPYQHNGESWELSAISGDDNYIVGGIFEGVKFSELLEKYTHEILGEDWVNKNGVQFPLLIKYIDAAQDLSIQVHPNDEYAQKKHNSLGKNEMWYIVDAEPNSRIILGFNKDTTANEFENHLKNNKITDLLQEIVVKKGDVFFVETGTIHAIGAGIVLAEIQQTSDITYRIFDWNRLDPSGQPRDLHIESAMETLNFNKNGFSLNYKKLINQENEMVDNNFFTTTYLPLDGIIKSQTNNGFTIYMCLEGTATIESESDTFQIKKGTTFLIPAAMNEFSLIGKANLLVSRVRCN
jgi:mannose-6-phosphate isomerase